MKSMTAILDDHDMYATMVKHSPKLWTVHPCGVVCTSEIVPDRATLIEDFMSLPCYTPWKDAKGYSQFGEPRYATVEEATLAVDALRIPHSELQATQ